MMSPNDLTKNLNAEASVLGSMILDRECIDNVRRTLRDKFYFTKIEHRILYDCLCALHETAESWDLVLIRDALKSKGTLDAAGGMDYVIKLAESVPTAANVSSYATLVERAYKRRKIAEHGASLLRAASEPGDVQAVIQNVLRDTHELSLETSDAESVDGAAAVERAIEETIRHRRRILRMPWSATSHLTNGIQQGSVTIFCGSPGASKSFASLELLTGVIESGHSAAYFGLEDSAEFHLTRALAQRTETQGLTNPDWVAKHPEIARAALTENSDWLKQMGRSVDVCGNGAVTYDRLSEWLLRRARSGCKMMIVDPISAIQHKTRQIWSEDSEFLLRTKQIAGEHGAAVVLVTHPSKLEKRPDMTALAGGAAFSRFAQTILWLEAHSERLSAVRYATGTMATPHNRTIHILKARLGKGQGARIACSFTESLRLIEHGPIVRKRPEQDDSAQEK